MLKHKKHTQKFKTNRCSANLFVPNIWNKTVFPNFLFSRFNKPIC